MERIIVDDPFLFPTQTPNQTGAGTGGGPGASDAAAPVVSAAGKDDDEVKRQPLKPTTMPDPNPVATNDIRFSPGMSLSTRMEWFVSTQMLCFQ